MPSILRNLIKILVVVAGTATVAVAWAQKKGTFDGREPIVNAPEFTIVIQVKDAQKAAAAVRKAGGEVVYDPNLGIGHDIPFLVVSLPGEKAVDEEFIKSLEVQGREVRSPYETRTADCNCEPDSIQAQESPSPETDQLSFESLFVPVEDLNLPQLRERVPGEGRGKGIIVAVIDTGVDASHPIFQDRVIYCSDATREGRFKLEKVKGFEGKVTFQDKPLTIPKRLADQKEVFVGVIDETDMDVQSSDAEKTNERQGLDFNRNGSVKDRFLVVVGADKPSEKPEDKPVDQPDTKPGDEEADKEADKDEPQGGGEGSGRQGTGKRIEKNRMDCLRRHRW